MGVVIVAAGTGSRTGSAELKQFRWIAGRPMLLHSVQNFQARADVAMVVAVLPRAYAGDPPPWIFQSDLDRLLISVGGRERGESVMNGLEDLPSEVRVVVVHDAARPLVPAHVVDDVIESARAGRATLAALPVTDTLKRIGADGTVLSTVDREHLWRAQTPQAFPRDVIDAVYRRARSENVVATDDAALCELYGIPVHVVRGSELSMKITAERDFALAEALSMLRE